MTSIAKPTGSLAPKSLAPTPGVTRSSLKLTIEPLWPTIRTIRHEVGVALADAPSALKAAAMMTASELTENAIKYGESVDSAPNISFKFERFDAKIRIDVANGCTNAASVEQLVNMIDEISRAPDKEALYFARVQCLLDNQDETGKLGLYRIALEGQFELACSYDDNVVTVAAIRSTP